MKGIFTPGELRGEVRVPASKSQAHRAMIFEAGTRTSPRSSPGVNIPFI